MSYKELLARYQNDELTAAERAALEAELEKYEALTDFYAAREPTDTVLPLGEAEQSELLTMKRAVRKRSRRRGVALVLVVASLFVVYSFLAVPLLNRFVFMPDAYAPDTDTETYAALTVLSDLHWEGEQITHVQWTSSGMDRFAFQMKVNDGYSVQETVLSGELKQGSIYGLSMDGSGPYRSAITFPHRTGTNDNCLWGTTKEEQLSELSKLPDFLQCSTMISFHQDISLAAYREIFAAGTLLPDWIAVRSYDTTAENTDSLGYTGAEPLDADGNSIYMAEIGFAPRGLYRDSNYLQTNYGIEPLAMNAGAEELSTHFRTLLRFQQEHAAELENLHSYELLPLSTGSTEAYYDAVADYVDAHGVQTYGVVIHGRPSEIIALCQSSDTICAVNIRDIRYAQ